MTDADLVAYERDLLAWVREAFAEGRLTVPLDRFPYALGIELHGHFPDARISIRYRDPRVGQDRLVDLDVYDKDDSGEGMRDQLERPQTEGYMIATNSEETGFLNSSRPADDQPGEAGP